MKKRVRKVGIANRGEVAVRIIRACHELGLETVLLHSEADRNTLAYRLADECVCIGPAEVTESYLSIENTVEGANSADVDALHPGFGFLSENADFAQACEDKRIIFVGPHPETIRLFGDKVSAKKLVQQAGGPLIPGYQGKDQSEKTLIQEMEKIGYPVMVKAAAGGGGRGLKVVRNKEQAQSAIESAKREGLNSFGSDQVFLEKYLDQAKHVEVQVFGDYTGEVFHLFERECSVQRRHQKVIEEALSPSLSEELRQQMTGAAVDIAKAGEYRGAGTVEFLVQDNQFYFLEMNTRLQVEHPVTEMVVGVDLVKAQLYTALGIGLIWDQEDLKPQGHAIECRLYAEDPYKNGLPSTGRLGGCKWPYGPFRRFEIGFESGDEITPFYDSMIAKAVVWDESRPRAIQKMRKVLSDTIIFGVKTNIPFLQQILQHQQFTDGVMTTAFLESEFSEGLQYEEPSAEIQSWLEKAYQGAEETPDLTSKKDGLPNPWITSWGSA